MTRANTIARPRKTGLAKADRNGRPTSKLSNLTKKTRLIILLSKNSGSDITSISKRFGWLPHTTRAALSRRTSVRTTTALAAMSRNCNISVGTTC